MRADGMTEGIVALAALLAPPDTQTLQGKKSQLTCLASKVLESSICENELPLLTKTAVIEAGITRAYRKWHLCPLCPDTCVHLATNCAVNTIFQKNWYGTEHGGKVSTQVAQDLNRCLC